MSRVSSGVCVNNSHKASLPDKARTAMRGASPRSLQRATTSNVSSAPQHFRLNPGLSMSDDAQVYGLKKTTALPKNRFKKTTALPQNWFSKGHSGKFDSDEDDMVGSRLDNNHENTAPTGAINGLRLEDTDASVKIMENGAKIKDLLHQIKLLKQEISDGDADFTGVVMTQREIRELNTKKEILCFTQERMVLIIVSEASRALDAKSLVGSYVSSTGDHGKFVIVEGPLLWTMKEGKWLVCQDVDRASDVSFIKCSISLGKTSIVEALARLSGKKLQRINLSDQTDLLDLYGADASVEGASPGQFERKDASLLDAFQKGDWVLLDEMNLAPQTVLEGLNGCLDYRERDLTNLPRTEPPPRPPPTHLNTIPTGNGSNLNHPSSSTLTTSPALYGDSSKQPPGSEFRPALARNLTALNQSSRPRQCGDHPCRLAPSEQFREQHKPLPTQVATLSEPSALESVIVRHVATLILASESSAIKDDTSLDKLLEIIKARKGNFWGKLFKGGNNKTKIKKKENHRLHLAEVDNYAARRKTLHLICCVLLKAHRDMMEVLFVFLKWVASFSHVDEETGSKIALQNLATVITPNIFYARSKDPTRNESFLAIPAVHELLRYQDELFQMPREVQLIMQDRFLSCMDEITSKDSLKRVDALLEANHGKLRPAVKLGA
ncbi:hypothetical protein KEM48_001322 [Puccinia striiformis f. sp. tritici PST-130]|nr:hypothetical protein KEM48_001322 [Puccinia striiformis f. sp. tritici PST-130]